jgi:tellurite resistance protein TerC
MAIPEIWLWVGFTLFILAMLGVDLGVMQRRPHVIGMPEALAWFGVWMGLALLFNIGVLVWHPRGGAAGLEFLTGFLVEKSLSVDNVFVFILIFRYFRVPAAYQHKVLFWGIVGAIVLRVLFIVGGIALMERFHWTMYVFGAFLVATGLSMMRQREAEYDPAKNWVVRQFRRFFPVTPIFHRDRFFIQQDGRWWATPLFVTLLAIESVDIVFAADSIPAIFAITPDPFIVYTSNIFAMLGLRALYFVVAGFMQMFHALHYGFASIILILGVKMLLTDVYKMPVALSLVLIIVILLVCIIVSLLRPRRADLKMVFERTERLGLIPFRRLLLIENVIDLGSLKVRDAMRTRQGTRVVDLALPWAENLQRLRETRFSRYPVVRGDAAKPVGILHVKDLLVFDDLAGLTSDQLAKLARPYLEVRDDLPLEDLLGRFQRRFEQMAMVANERGEWTGLITIEDILEEIVGKIGDEYDVGRAGRYVSLADALSPGRVLFELSAASIPDAIRQMVARVPAAEWPVSPAVITRAALEREASMGTYLGHGLAVPHARVEGIDSPVLAFARSDEGVPVEGTTERAELFFLLVTPASLARQQPLMLADIVGLFESEYVVERLRKSTTAEELVEAIRAGQQVALD